ncbi:MAG: 3-oxoacyl-[Alphaproteobacteria bacterium]|nr:3-oxoacyl-[acyl-carrier-protein] reductase [Alphaproteobacteria bacterium]
MFDLSGKIALVTGATGGIGGAVAKTLHSLGAEIIATGRKEEALAKLADELGSRVHVLVGDLGNKDAADKLVADAEAVAGKIDILVNNAGLTRDGLFIRMKDEDWQKVLDVNLTAAFLLSRAAVRGMMKRRMGRIINISSIVGAIGNAGQANYAASKAGLIAMSKCLAQEIAARNVTVNCVAPGFIETPMTDAIPEEARNALIAKIPMDRLGTPEDVANAVAFLASDEAAYITGQVIHVNGGMAMF